MFRGKKKTNRKEQIELLHELYGITTDNKLGAGIQVKIMFSITSALFDYNPKLNDAMKVSVLFLVVQLLHKYGISCFFEGILPIYLYLCPVAYFTFKA